MVVAWLLAVVVGVALGYLIAQRAAKRYWQRELVQQQLTLETEKEGLQQQLQQLRQEAADLRYRLGESEKARRYLERRGGPGA
jgi:uncharacterized membrane-anchored protein YhcB (DUF1043 family)